MMEDPAAAFIAKRRRIDEDDGADEATDGSVYAFRTVASARTAAHDAFLLSALRGDGCTTVVPQDAADDGDGTAPGTVATLDDVAVALDKECASLASTAHPREAAKRWDAAACRAGMAYRPHGAPPEIAEAFLVPLAALRAAARGARSLMAAYARREVWVAVQQTVLDATLEAYAALGCYDAARAAAFVRRARPCAGASGASTDGDELVEVPVTMACLKFVAGLNPSDASPEPYRVHHMLADTAPALCCGRDGEVVLMETDGATRALVDMVRAAEDQERRCDGASAVGAGDGDGDSDSHMVLLARACSADADSAAAAVALVGEDDAPDDVLRGLCRRMLDGRAARGAVATYLPLGIADPPPPFPSVDALAFPRGGGPRGAPAPRPFNVLMELSRADVRRIAQVFGKGGASGGEDGGRRRGQQEQQQQQCTEFDGVTLAVHVGGVIACGAENRECVLCVGHAAEGLAGAAPAVRARVAALRGSCSDVDVSPDARVYVARRAAPSEAVLQGCAAEGVLPPRLARALSASQAYTVTMLLDIRDGVVARVAIAEVYSSTHTSTIVCDCIELDDDL